MTSISPYSEDAPDLSGEPIEDDRIPKRAAELLEDWRQDPIKLAEAAEHVTGFTTWSDTLPQDIAAMMIGDHRDQASRDLVFMVDLRRRVNDRLREMANEQAESESINWMPWHEELRRRLK